MMEAQNAFILLAELDKLQSYLSILFSLSDHLHLTSEKFVSIYAW